MRSQCLPQVNLCNQGWWLWEPEASLLTPMSSWIDWTVCIDHEWTCTPEGHPACAHWLEIKQCYRSSPLCSFSYKELTYAATPVSIIRIWKWMWFFYSHYAYLIHYIGTEAHQNSDYPQRKWRAKYRRELAWGKAGSQKASQSAHCYLSWTLLPIQTQGKCSWAQIAHLLFFFFFFMVYTAFGTSPVAQW